MFRPRQSAGDQDALAYRLPTGIGRDNRSNNQLECQSPITKPSLGFTWEIQRSLADRYQIDRSAIRFGRRLGANSESSPTIVDEFAKLVSWQPESNAEPPVRSIEPEVKDGDQRDVQELIRSRQCKHA